MTLAVCGAFADNAFWFGLVRTLRRARKFCCAGHDAARMIFPERACIAVRKDGG
jgi:hypothetical protein